MISESAPDTTPDLSDLTLDELRVALAPMVADSAIFDGWTYDAVEAAAEMEGVDTDVARLAFPGGAMDMIGAWIEAVDAQMALECPRDRLGQMPIRERIRVLVQCRLDAIDGLEEALKRATAIMAMPQNLPATARRSWKSADLMWRLTGDTATDYNHYTKRTILGGIYAATLAIFADDTSEGKARTKEFLDRRIEGVMKFEKTKAKWLNSDRESFSVTRFLGRLRYPAR
ncbi:MAG: COQ9 family protein [Pontixanthobacter sp.]